MPAQQILGTGATRPGTRGAILRRSNGSIDIGAYAAIAHRERAAAIASSMLWAVRFIRDAGLGITAQRFHKQSGSGESCV